MSHFTVMVIGDNPEKQLARYNENINHFSNEWLTFHNVEEEYRLKYEIDTKHTKEIYYNWITIKPEDMDKLEQGSTDITITNIMDSTFINLDSYKYYCVCTRDLKDKRRMHVEINSVNKLAQDNVVIHATKVEIDKIPIKDIMSWDNYITEYCGYKFNEEYNAYGYWANDKAKWDWYQLGGRWNGYLKLKSKDPSGSVIGDDGVFGPSREDFSGRGDQTIKGNIDIEAMREEEAEAARKRYQMVEYCFGGKIPKIEIPWSYFIAEDGPYKDVDWNERLEKYYSQYALTELQKVKEKVDKGEIQIEEPYLFNLFNLEEYNYTEEEYVKINADSALATFAVIKDGIWYEKGEMGWWACVSNEIDQNEWNRKVNEMFEELPNDTLISIYDCHI